MATGGDIEALDYNTIRENIIAVMGTGSGTFGYGQTIQSSPVFAGNTITKNQWDNLRYDILNARIHQSGLTPSIISLSDNALINDEAGDPVVNYASLTEISRNNRFDIATTRKLLSAIGIGNATPTPVEGEYVYTSSWNTELSIELTCTFNNANEARYFFNSGGVIQITPSITGYTSTSQNESWNEVLSQAGTQEFGANTDPSVNYYTLTDEYQIYYINVASASYLQNFYKLEAKTDVIDNSTGLATILYIKVTLSDGYTDPGNNPGDNPNTDDIVDGTTKITFAEVKANGTLQPTGNFTITSPFYSVGSFSAS